MVSFTNWPVKFGWRLISHVITRQSYPSTTLTLATTLAREGAKIKINTWLGKRLHRKRRKLLCGIRSSLKGPVRWVKKQMKTRKTYQLWDEVVDNMALHAAVKYRDLAERRATAAKIAFDIAANELKAAKCELKDAEEYIQGLRMHQIKETDIVFVEEHVQVPQSYEGNVAVPAPSVRVVPIHALVPLD